MVLRCLFIAGCFSRNRFYAVVWLCMLYIGSHPLFKNRGINTKRNHTGGIYEKVNSNSTGSPFGSFDGRL